MIRTVLSLAALAVAFAIAGCASVAREPVQFAGAPCAVPRPMRCPDKDCPAATVTNGGAVVEPKTGRTYFLDYPCDLKPGEKVTVVLSLHGGGSYGNWQRHYFPLVDLVDKHRLVVATPYAPARFWGVGDDAYLQNVAQSVIDRVGPKNIKAFWLAGHSQGGMTSNRIVCSDYFRDKVDGWLSLSGGRIGPAGLAANFGGPGRAAAAPGAAAPAPAAVNPAAFPPIDGVNGPEAARPGAAVTPKCDINFIFTTGDLEIAGLPETSPWAEKYGCAPRVRRADVTDVKPGYVYDGNSQNPPNPAWGRLPRGGTAEVMIYPGCRGGKLVADVLRRDKGHTEGLEPNVTETLVRLMLSAPGGKLRAAAG